MSSLTALPAPRHHPAHHNTVDRLKHPPYIMPMTFDDTLDAIGLLCPLPVLKARKRLQAMASGQVLKLLADDPAAVIDVPHYCAESGHTLVSSADADDHRIYLIRRA